MTLKQLTAKQQRLVTSGLRGFWCAGLATLITASFSWTFVVSVARSGNPHEFWTKLHPLATMRPAYRWDTLHGHQQSTQPARTAPPG